MRTTKKFEKDFESTLIVDEIRKITLIYKIS